MKYLVFAVSMTLFNLNSVGQKFLTTQAQVDSMTLNIDTSKSHYVHLKYDSTLPQSKAIIDLSGFNDIRWMWVKLVGFPWKDIPWFTSVKIGGFELYDMPNLETISGVNDYEGGGVEIHNCPSLINYPPKGMLKYCNSLIITNMAVDELNIDLSEVSRYPRNNAWSNKLTLWDNDIKKLNIKDPNGIVHTLTINYDSSMTNLKLEGGDTLILLEIYGNPVLTRIRGFQNARKISPTQSISYNLILSDICALRKGLDAYYQGMRTKANFNNYKVVANGYGASSYQEMMADSCEWLKYVSVKENQVSFNEIVVYPNPANDKFTVKLNNQNPSGVVKLYNLQGSVVLQKEVQENENQHQLSFFTSNLPRGIYLLEFVGQNGERENVKVVLQ